MRHKGASVATHYFWESAFTKTGKCRLVLFFIKAKICRLMLFLMQQNLKMIKNALFYNFSQRKGGWNWWMKRRERKSLMQPCHVGTFSAVFFVKTAFFKSKNHDRILKSTLALFGTLAIKPAWFDQKKAHFSKTLYSRLKHVEHM